MQSCSVHMLPEMRSVSSCGRPSISHGEYFIIWIPHTFRHNLCRNRIPWAVITTTCFCSALGLLLLRYLLAADNARRKEEQGFTHELGPIRQDGTAIEVDRASHDLTDRENREFRYVY